MECSSIDLAIDAREMPLMLGERCQVEIKLDGKGRIALPARMRKRLQDEGIDKLVLTFFDGGIRAFLEGDFQTLVEAPIRQLDPFDPEAQDLHHTVLAGAEDCAVDAQGRLRIPAHLRDEAGITRLVVLHSILEWFEIWDLEAWRARQAEARRARAERRGRRPAELHILRKP